MLILLPWFITRAQPFWLYAHEAVEGWQSKRMALSEGC